MSKLRSPSIIWLKALPPTAVSTTACTSLTLRFHRAHLSRSTGRFRFDWPRMWNAPTFARPGIFCRARTTRSAVLSSSTRSGPMIFTELSPRTPESVSLTLLRMFCEKFQSTATSVWEISRFRASTSSSLVRGRVWPGGNRPLVVRLQRHVAFRAVEARRIGAVVGTADLADHLFALRVALDDAANDLHPFAHLVQRRFQREGARDPDVAFLKLGQELAAQHGDHRGGAPPRPGRRPPASARDAAGSGATAAGRQSAACAPASCRAGA